MNGLRVVQGVAGVMMLAVAPLLGKATRDYSINVHVTASCLITECVLRHNSICPPAQELDVMIDGSKYQLMSEKNFTYVMAL